VGFLGGQMDGLGYGDRVVKKKGKISFLYMYCFDIFVDNE